MVEHDPGEKSNMGRNGVFPRDDVDGGRFSDTNPIILGTDDPRSPLEQDIINIAKLIVQEHYCLNLHSLYLICTKRISYASGPEIELAINRLVKAKVFFHGKSLIKDEVLENRNRLDIWGIIRDLPGIYFSRINELLELGNRLLSWHLEVLGRYNYIRKVKHAGKHHYFDKLSPRRLDQFHILLQDWEIIQIYQTIYKHPRSTTGELLKKVSISRSTFYRKLNMLVEHSLCQFAIQDDTKVLLVHSKEYQDLVKEFMIRKHYWENKARG